MANKKKKTSTKGLAGIPVYGSNAKTGKDIRLNKKVKPKKLDGGYNYLGDVETVTVPKQWLSSPDHVVAELAYITPAEQKILIDANLYGSLDGKPNRAPGGLMSLQGDFGGGDTYSGGSGDDAPGTDSAAEAASDAGASNDSQASSDSGGDSGGSPVTDSGAQHYRPGAGTYAKQLVQDMPETQNTGLRGFVDRLFGGTGGPSEEQAKEYYKQRIEDGPLDPDTGMSQSQQKALDALANQYERAQTGVLGKLPGLAGAIGSKIATTNIEKMTEAITSKGGRPVFDAKGNVTRVDLPGGGFYGRGEEKFDTDSGDDDSGISSGVVASLAKPAAKPAVTPNAYYQRGVGTQTIDLSDPAQRRMYLLNLIGQTQSPIGATYDPRTASYTMPGRVSGLDIFKRK